MLVLHFRWMIVLAKLKELNLNDTIAAMERLECEKNAHKLKKSLDLMLQQKATKRNVAEIVRELGLEILFLQEDATVVLDVSADGFDQWFGIREERKSGRKTEGVTRGVDKSSPFNTVYQCRNFYALDAPNNLVQRLSKILEVALSELKFDTYTDRGSKHDRYIRQWGAYAFKLVQSNGGWNVFDQMSSLSDVQDVWPTEEEFSPKVSESEKNASNSRSFVQRVLFLERDRYIQILTSTVGTLWPLWFLKSDENIQLLKEISNYSRKDKNLHLGKTLPDDSLFIDINPFIGSMAGLPYPFGSADFFLSQGMGISGNISYQFGDPWPSSSQIQVANKLQDESWCPPLLFAVRGDQSGISTNSNKNAVVPFIQISEKCTNFSRIYIRREYLSTRPSIDGKSNSEWLKEFELWFTSLRFGIEEGTYGDNIVEKLQKNGLSSKPMTLSRLEMAMDCGDRDDVDIVLLFPPVDTLTQASEKFKRISDSEVYEVFGEYGSYFPQNFPSCVLCTGNFARSQPKMRELLTDFCAYLGSTYYLFHYFSPSTASLSQDFDLLHLEDVRRKKTSARRISEFCNIIQEDKPLDAEKLVHSRFIEVTLKKIGEEMSYVLFRKNEVMRLKFMESWAGWSWAELLERLQDISIFITYDFS